jgi:endonuclease/exonuclease/phosphatase family metal-dependent hydrolase
MKLITWNVQWFCGLDRRVDVQRVLDEARAWADFDVLCLQEVAVNYPALEGGAGFDQVARVRELLPGYEVFFGAAVDTLGPDGQRQRFGNLIATRLPALQVQHHPLPYPGDAGVRSMPRMCSSVTVASKFGPLRVMTAHLEYFSRLQRLAQTQGLLELHAQACAQAAAPPLHDASGSPFQDQPHTAQAILCGDFNFDASGPEYALVQATGEFSDAWRVLHPETPQAPTFHVFDKRYAPDPVCCDFVWLSAGLQAHVKRMEVNSLTRASDHQPVLLELG